MNIKTYDIVEATAPTGDVFTGLVVGFCDTSEIVTLISFEDEHSFLGRGWVERYAGINNIKKLVDK